MLARRFHVQLSITTRLPMTEADIGNYLECLADLPDFVEVKWLTTPSPTEGNYYFECECGAKLHFSHTEGTCPTCNRHIRLEHQGAYPRPSVEKTVTERYEEGK